MIEERIMLCWLTGWMIWWSICDLHSRRLMLWQLLVVLGIGLLWQWMQGRLFSYDMAGGGLVGMFALLVSCLSGGGFGKGDGLVLLCMGIYLGFWDTLTSWMLALALSSVAGLFLVWVEKKSWKWTLPFLPYLTAALVIFKVLQWQQRAV